MDYFLQHKLRDVSLSAQQHGRLIRTCRRLKCLLSQNNNVCSSSHIQEEKRREEKRENESKRRETEERQRKELTYSIFSQILNLK